MRPNEQGREDPLREATALVERIEFRLPEAGVSVVVGFRANAAASVFWGEDPVYQFNSARELRRVYYGGDRIKASEGELYRVLRSAKNGRIVLVSEPLGEERTRDLMAALNVHLAALRVALTHDTCVTVGQVPETADVRQRVAIWLDGLSAVQVARRPHAD